MLQIKYPEQILVASFGIIRKKNYGFGTPKNVHYFKCLLKLYNSSELN